MIAISDSVHTIGQEDQSLVCHWLSAWVGGTAAAAPPPFRPSEPALCGSCPLVTPIIL